MGCRQVFSSMASQLSSTGRLAPCTGLVIVVAHPAAPGRASAGDSV